MENKEYLVAPMRFGIGLIVILVVVLLHMLEPNWFSPLLAVACYGLAILIALTLLMKVTGSSPILVCLVAIVVTAMVISSRGIGLVEAMKFFFR